MDTNTNSTPLVSPLVALAKSRKAVAALITAGITLLVDFAPGLEAHRADLLAFSMALWTILATVLIGSISHEDAAAKSLPKTVAAGGDVVVTPPAKTSTPENAAG